MLAGVLTGMFHHTGGWSTFRDREWGAPVDPASPHYDDQTELFVEGRTLPWAFSQGAVVAATENRLVLVPAETAEE